MRTALWETIGTWVPGPVTRHIEDSFDTRVPCKRDAFSFNVTVREVWSRQGRPDDLALAVAARKEAHRATVRQQLRLISRRYPPYASALVEHTANEDLGHTEPVADEPGLTCTCSFEAAPDEVLVEHLQQAERDRLTAEANHDAMTRNLERLEAIERRWLGFLRLLGRDALGPAIARLVGDQELADAIARYAEQQEQVTQDLRDLCDTATEAYREKGLYELVMTTDNAFKRLLDHISPEAASSLNGHGQNGRRPYPAP